MSTAQGFAFTAHFCGDKLASLDFFTQEDNCEPISKNSVDCCAIKAKQDKPCCTDKKVELKAKKDFLVEKYPDFSAVVGTAFESQPLKAVLVIKCEEEQILELLPDAHAPPLYILFCTLKIHLG
ncbi:hypothetical protein CHX27_12025 [Flavobacterium aurantiibacter]|uniref:Uncharacterized protein n=1 Tax=Flavobacterium aurantiibacter TaxID=2023067 RepID=A0A255ZMX4_9FLAO|nr:hypothetical protein [Flavobacterium aurantiibacter]OYQ42225.1 hypothetical protein CHX27_12025 [Flavobacterium aurantiibacter]